MKTMFTILLTLLFCLSVATAEEVKDPRPAVGAAGVSRDVGPDAFGYTVLAGYAFNLQDISASGTFLIDGDDVGLSVALDEPFEFYGIDYAAMSFTSNGYLSTDPTDTGPDLSNDCPVPASPSTGGGARIYPLHDDLDLEPGFGAGYVQYFEICPQQGRDDDEPCTVFMWDDVAHFPGGLDQPIWDVNVFLMHRTGDMVFVVGAGNPEVGAGSTTGIQNVDATIGLNVFCDTADSMPDNSVVFIGHPNPVANEQMSFGAMKALYR